MNINLTLFAQIITFMFFWWFCHAFVWKFIRNAMTVREKKIADGLEAADRASRDLELAQDKAAQQLRLAKEEAAGIIDGANKRANQIVEEAKERAREEAGRIKVAAEAEVALEANRAKEALRKQVGALVLAGATKVLEASIDESAHQALVEKLAAGL
ncbi:MAG: synthase, subunit b [Verrucomicrobiaceae bacterium]|nr:synthase, subunit b [Verrucomicrobiaceae bacterium]